MVQGKLPVPGRPTIWITVGQGSTALAVSAGGGGLDIFTLIYLYRAVSQREGEKGEKRIDESKNVQTTPTRTYYKCSRPLPYCYPNCRTPRHWKFTQHHRTTRPPLQPSRWSGGAKVLGKLHVPGRPTIWITVGQGPIAHVVGTGGRLFGNFYSYLFFLSSFSLPFGNGPI